MRRDYEDSALITADGPFSGGLIVAESALCPDGIRRDAHPSGDGTADTFFSIPAFVYVGRTRVYGYIGADDTVYFRPYLYRRNWARVYSPLGAFAVRVLMTIADSRNSSAHSVTYAVPSSYTDTETEHDYRVAVMRAEMETNR